MLIQVTLKSGAKIEFEAEELKIEKNSAGYLLDLSWETPEEFTKSLEYIKPDEVAAIVEVNKTFHTPGPIPPLEELQKSAKEIRENA